LGNNPHVNLAVSAVIPTYNRAELVQRAISSALAALEPGDEVIVVDDGSEDDTVAVVEAFGPQVRLLQRDHGGAGAARNAGFAAARTDLVAFLDSDDEWFPDKIALQRAFLEARPDVLFCCSDFGVRLEDGSEILSYLERWLHQPVDFADAIGPPVRYSTVAPLPRDRPDFDVFVGSIYHEEMLHNFVTAFTVMVRRERGAALHFAEDLPTAEEWPAFGRLAKDGDCALFATETAWQHGHSGPRLTQQYRYILAEAWLKTLDRIWGQDQKFLDTHAKEYQRTRSMANLMRATSLARHGELRGAAHALRLAGFAAITIKALQWLVEVFPG
jgi:glycosyltransferase involved in cell wall biosynthesis